MDFIFFTEEIKTECQKLISKLIFEERLDFDSALPNPLLSTDSLWKEFGGQMFGMALCLDFSGNKVILKAFSGQFNGVCQIDGWVPPLFPVPQYQAVVARRDETIHALTAEICQLQEKKLISPQMVDLPHLPTKQLNHLLEQRKKLSQIAMEDIFLLYRFHCADGKIRGLEDCKIEGRGGLPTGTGDCCAPKLLNFAYSQGLQFLGLAEFYFGAINRRGDRHNGEFYPPCKEKCGLILPIMLGLDIIYQDSSIIVVNKPAGFLSVPGRGEKMQDCVVTRLKRLFPHCIDQPAVHRLDMDTSGLMIFALTQSAHRHLSKQFIGRKVQKRYIALLDGLIRQEEGEIELSFRLDPDNRPHQIYDPLHGKRGKTLWRRIEVERGGTQTRIEFTPLTGRTHQLRVHSAHPLGLGVPIVGDRLYGEREEGQRMYLHASFLSFFHPETELPMEFNLPADY